MAKAPTLEACGRRASLACLIYASHLGHDEQTVERMLKGEEKISPADQQLIALALRRNPRDLYTDIAPS
jgi:hypothetical protein